MKKLMALMALTILTACDSAERGDFRAEQDDRVYKSAMADYQAGRLDAAIAGFEKAVRKNPANASARFQLACLLQDSRRDFVGAYCGYREYLMQHPESDKAKLAADRLAICEKEVAKALVTKYGLGGSEALSKELAAAMQELKKVRTRIAQTEKNFGASQARVRSLLAERDRLLKVIKGGEGREDVAVEKPSVKEIKDLLEENDGEVAPPVPDDVAQIRADEQDALSTEGMPPSKDKVAELLADDEDLKEDSGLPTADGQKPSAGQVANANAATPKPDAETRQKPKGPAHPATYVVEDGDTLYGLSKRFYGDLSAWKRIRDANKALISSDNRLRAGDTLVLP